jgi:hypothetical protein
MKNSPFFRLKFLKDLVKSAKERGDKLRELKVTGIIQKEAMRKQWRWINRSTHKAQGSLTVWVKVQKLDGSHDKFKTKDSLFYSVSPILLERFQSALIAPCHRGTFFEDLGLDQFPNRS